MSLYLLLDLLDLAGPLLLSFDRKVRYVRKWPYTGLAILTVSPVYIVWDVLVTEAGHWSFNEAYTAEFTLFGLPPGEIGFFLVVPFSCLFIYEVVRTYLPERRLRLPAPFFSLLAAGLLLFSGLAWPRTYTLLALLALGLFFLLSSLLLPSLLRSSSTWLYLLGSFLAFLLVNGVLTALPVVTYGEEFFLGIRLYTIPFEDFLYNASMLGFYLLAYLGFQQLVSRHRRSRTGEGSL